MLKHDWTCGLIKWDQCTLTYKQQFDSLQSSAPRGGANKIPTMLLYQLISHIMVI